MSSTPLDECPATDREKVWAEKQNQAREVLWSCLKDPPQVEVKVSPGELRVAAMFSIGSPGVEFEDVEAGPKEIVVAAKLDPATVEVNMEKLAALAGLESVGEAVSIWESFKEQVGSIPPTSESDDDDSVEIEQDAVESIENKPASSGGRDDAAHISATQVDDANAAITELASRNGTRKRKASERAEDDRI